MPSWACHLWADGQRIADRRGKDALLVRALARGGQWDLAALRLAAWPRVHPTAGAELLSLWNEIVAGRERAPLPGSPFVSFVP